MPNIVRRVTKVEESKPWTDMFKKKKEETVYQVWWDDNNYEYVWAKDELEAYKRAMRDERELAVGEHTKP